MNWNAILGIEGIRTMDYEKRESKPTRREVLKKGKTAALFVIPTILTFNVKDLHAQASSPPGTPGEW